MSQVSVRQRPALVTFAAILLFLLGGFELATTLAELLRPSVALLPAVYGATASTLWVWALIDILFAIVLFFAGYALLQGQPIGWWVGMIVAILAAIRWFFYLWEYPWVGVIAIGISVLVIYGLTVHMDYFVND
jgi:hypothetical protein